MKLALIGVALVAGLTVFIAWPKIPEPPDSVKNVAELDAFLEKLVSSGTPQGLSMAILQLQEQGKLQLDDSVSRYLSFFKVEYPSQNSTAITIRHLLNHSSGIPDASPFTLMKWIHHDGEAHVNQTAFVEQVFPEYAGLEFEPGENTAYTNIGYMLLGADLNW